MSATSEPSDSYAEEMSPKNTHAVRELNQLLESALRMGDECAGGGGLVGTMSVADDNPLPPATAGKKNNKNNASSDNNNNNTDAASWRLDMARRLSSVSE